MRRYRHSKSRVCCLRAGNDVVTHKCVVQVVVGERHEMSPEKVAQE